MEFNIMFGEYYPIKTDARTVGIDALDHIRHLLEIPRLSHHLVDKDIPGVWQSPTVPIPEKIARDSGHFRDGATITVMVPQGHFNKYMYDQVIPTRSPDDGAITKVKIESRLDPEQVIGAWIDAGYPLKWGIEEEQSE